MTVLCSRNARPQKALVEGAVRAQQPPSFFSVISVPPSPVKAAIEFPGCFPRSNGGETGRGSTACRSFYTSPFCFRRRPIHFGVTPAIIAEEPIAGLSAGVGQGYKGNRSVVERAGRLIMKQMDFGHHRN